MIGATALSLDVVTRPGGIAAGARHTGGRITDSTGRDTRRRSEGIAVPTAKSGCPVYACVQRHEGDRPVLPGEPGRSVVSPPRRSAVTPRQRLNRPSSPTADQLTCRGCVEFNLRTRHPDAFRRDRHGSDPPVPPADVRAMPPRVPATRRWCMRMLRPTPLHESPVRILALDAAPPARLRERALLRGLSAERKVTEWSVTTGSRAGPIALGLVPDLL